MVKKTKLDCMPPTEDLSDPTLGALLLGFLAFCLLFFTPDDSSSLCRFSSSSSAAASSSSSELLSGRRARFRDDKGVEGCRLIPASAVQSE